MHCCPYWAQPLPYFFPCDGAASCLFQASPCPPPWMRLRYSRVPSWVRKLALPERFDCGSRELRNVFYSVFPPNPIGGGPSRRPPTHTSRRLTVGRRRTVSTSAPPDRMSTPPSRRPGFSWPASANTVGIRLPSLLPIITLAALGSFGEERFRGKLLPFSFGFMEYPILSFTLGAGGEIVGRQRPGSWSPRNFFGPSWRRQNLDDPLSR